MSKVLMLRTPDLECWMFSRHFMYLTSILTQPYKGIISPFYSWGNWGFEKFNDLLPSKQIGRLEWNIVQSLSVTRLLPWETGAERGKKGKTRSEGAEGRNALSSRKSSRHHACHLIRNLRWDKDINLSRLRSLRKDSLARSWFASELSWRWGYLWSWVPTALTATATSAFLLWAPAVPPDESLVIAQKAMPSSPSFSFCAVDLASPMPRMHHQLDPIMKHLLNTFYISYRFYLNVFPTSIRHFSSWPPPSQDEHFIFQRIISSWDRFSDLIMPSQNAFPLGMSPLYQWCSLF